jgi:hypothetical protein
MQIVRTTEPKKTHGCQGVKDSPLDWHPVKALCSMVQKPELDRLASQAPAVAAYCACCQTVFIVPLKED